MKDRMLKWTTRLLVAFILVSVGFAIGKETTRNQMLSEMEATQPPAAAVKDKVIVYYMHATFRCVTCNNVESMGEELVRTEFADAVKAGQVEWKAVNYQDNNAMASRYNVGGNMIVVARFRNGKEVDNRRLDRVMELSDKRTEFMDYVRKAIMELMENKA